ncbi:hypothetical protein NL676_008278 [Syzygium grande]|nr:hypothetical protein NL676_008278 [Syzygium grande]
MACYFYRHAHLVAETRVQIKNHADFECFPATYTFCCYPGDAREEEQREQEKELRDGQNGSRTASAK